MKAIMLLIVMMMPFWRSPIDSMWTCPDPPWRHTLESSSDLPSEMVCLHEIERSAESGSGS